VAPGSGADRQHRPSYGGMVAMAHAGGIRQRVEACADRHAAHGVYRRHRPIVRERGTAEQAARV